MASSKDTRHEIVIGIVVALFALLFVDSPPQPAEAQPAAAQTAEVVVKNTEKPSEPPEKPKPAKVLDYREQWLKDAGVPENEWKDAIELVHRESSWNPEAINPSSGACGLAQSLPCSKIAGDWSDPIVALKWQLQYIRNRYGTYADALAFHDIHNWY